MFIISFLRATEAKIRKKMLHPYVVLVTTSMGITPIFEDRSALDGITGTNLTQVMTPYLRRMRPQLPLNRSRCYLGSLSLQGN